MRFWKKKEIKEEETPATEDSFTIFESSSYRPSTGRSFVVLKDKQGFLDRADQNAAMYSHDGYLIQEYAEVILSCQR